MFCHAIIYLSCTHVQIDHSHFITLVSSSKPLHLSWWPLTLGNPRTVLWMTHCSGCTQRLTLIDVTGGLIQAVSARVIRGMGAKRRGGRSNFVHPSVSVLQATGVEHKLRHTFTGSADELAELTVRESLLFWIIVQSRVCHIASS